MENLDKKRKEYIEKCTHKDFADLWKTFISEFSNFIKINWGKNYLDMAKLVEEGKLDEFNKHERGLMGFPSTSGYQVLAGTLDHPESTPLDEIMCHESQQIFFYLYYDAPIEEKPK